MPSYSIGDNLAGGLHATRALTSQRSASVPAETVSSFFRNLLRNKLSGNPDKADTAKRRIVTYTVTSNE